MRRLVATLSALLLASIPLHAEAAEDSSLPVLKGVDGVTALIEESKASGKPLVLHFFATWCDPCRDEMPKIRALAPRLQKRGVRLVLVSLDELGEAKAVAQFLKKYRVSAETYLLDAPDPEPITKHIDEAWEADLPATFVFKKGVRTASFRGPLKSARALDASLK